MILTGVRFLNSAKINMIVQDLASQLEIAKPLRFLNRCETVDAEDDEITGSFTGQIFAADLIMDDQRAVVYEGGQYEFYTTNIPNIKIGRRYGQRTLARLNRVRQALETATDVQIITNWENQTSTDLVLGCRMRMNALCAAMMYDSVTYNRYGVQISGTFGMPTDLKFNAAAVWSDHTNATPITDILTARDYASDTYGEVYNRVTMTTAHFRHVVQTVEFQNNLKGQIRLDLGANAFNPRDRRLRQLFIDILEMELEVDDSKITIQALDGTKSTSTVTPTNQILLSSTADDNNRAAYDFGNAVVVESIAAGIIGDPSNAAGGEQFGPYSYYTGNQDLNPPDVRAWSVVRGFPRKHRKTCTGRITVL